MAGLESALAKIGRAEEHLGSLQKEIGRWREQSGNRLARDNNAKRTEFRFYTDWNPPPDPTRWALLLADGIHNVRSALDHVVYECSGPKPPERCEFPIFLNKDRFFLPEKDPLGGLYKIRGIKKAAVRALIEEAQPWQHQERPQHHILWMLHVVDIQDKHRLLTPVGMVPRELRGKLGVVLFKEVDAPVQISGIGWVELKDHALVFTVRTPKPAKRVEMNGAVTLGIGIRVAGTDIGVTALLGDLCKHTRLLIEQVRDAIA